MKRCTLYRHFDVKDRLLYVGIALKPFNRLADHVQSYWHKNISKVTLQHFASKSEALFAERIAIAHECPVHNVMHRGIDLSAKIGAVIVQDIL